MSAAEGQAIAELTVRTLKTMRNDESFALFFDLVNRFCELTGTDPPVLPRKRRAPQRLEVGQQKVPTVLQWKIITGASIMK